MASKYKNKKTIVDGIEFDSKVESKYYTQLKWLQDNDQILFFRIQPRYLLQEAFEKNSVKHRKLEYVGDFEVHHKDGSIEVIDIKGAPPTEAFKIKRKLFEKKYPHRLSVITYKRNLGGWITYAEYERQRKLAKKERKANEGSKRAKTRINRVAKMGHKTGSKGRTKRADWQ